MSASKSNKKKFIIIIAAVVLVAAIVAAVIIIGSSKGWFSKEDGKAEDYSVSHKYDDTGKVLLEDSFYDKKGNLKYKVIKGYSDPDNTVLMQEVYRDESDKLIKMVNYDEAGSITGVDEYANDRVSVHREYSQGKATGNYTTYEYNDNGDNICTTEYDSSDKVIRTIKKEYNGNGDITLYLETDADGKQLSKTVYNYNEKGQEVKTVFYDADGETGYVEYQYDAQGRKTRMNEYADGKLISYRIYTYDENGAVKEEFHDA